MEDQLKLFPLLSLKQMAVRRTAVLLWKGFLAPDSRINRAVPYHTAQDVVIGKVSQLELPKLLKKQVADKVIPVGLEIRRWKKFLNDRLYNISFIDFMYLNQRRNYLSYRSRRMSLDFDADSLYDSTTLHWTTAGRIDYQKTVKGLCCDTFGVEELYEISCDYCLEDRIALLWEQLSEETKEYFRDEKKIYSGLSFQWPHILKGEQSKLDEWSREKHETNFNQYSFEISVEIGNKSAAEYFYQKLTPEEKDSVMRSFSELFKSIKLEDDFDGSMGETFCYLLTLMTPEQQMEKLKTHPIHLFFCFFDMIWPDLFLENASLILKHLPPKDYSRLQQAMVEKIKSKGEYSPELLTKIFTQSPPDFMKCFLGQESEYEVSMACCFLSTCFHMEDSDSVKALFRSLDVADRAKLVFHRSVLQFFVHSIISRGEWLMVELCLREAELPRGERERLKKHFERAFVGEEPKCVSQCKRFYDFLDAPDASSDEEKRGQKRQLENCSPE